MCHCSILHGAVVLVQQCFLTLMMPILILSVTLSVYVSLQHIAWGSCTRLAMLPYAHDADIDIKRYTVRICVIAAYCMGQLYSSSNASLRS